MTMPFAPDADHRAFRSALGRFATGVTLVTVDTADGPVGFAANSFSSVSMDPPLVLWSPAKSSSRFHHFAEAPHYAIHVLSADQAAWLPRFARGGEGFAGLTCERNPEGVPVLPGALARFDCARHAGHDGGDHLIIVGRVLRATMEEGAPLVFSQGRYGGFAG
ncbi:MAG: flavin reductase family protein [Gemmobacter sp.]|nr:flavin reductase family protein [Gemmobacter sp.]